MINAETISEPKNGINPFAISGKDNRRLPIPMNIKNKRSTKAIITIGKTQLNE